MDHYAKRGEKRGKGQTYSKTKELSKAFFPRCFFSGRTSLLYIHTYDMAFSLDG